MEWLEFLKNAKAELVNLTDVGADYIRKVADAGRKVMDGLDGAADAIDPTPGGASVKLSKAQVAERKMAEDFLAECRSDLAKMNEAGGDGAGVRAGAKGPFGRILLEVIIRIVEEFLTNRPGGQPAPQAA